jgi:hypothetical protein
MPDAAQINRSLGTIRTELEFLASSGVLSPPQFQSIQAQLPVIHSFMIAWHLTDLESNKMVSHLQSGVGRATSSGPQQPRSSRSPKSMSNFGRVTFCVLGAIVSRALLTSYSITNGLASLHTSLGTRLSWAQERLSGRISSMMRCGSSKGGEPTAGIATPLAG